MNRKSIDIGSWTIIHWITWISVPIIIAAAIYLFYYSMDHCQVYNGQFGDLLSGTVGVGTATPLASALLEVKSTTQGFLPPRMTEAERDLIPVTLASAGLTIWCTNCGVRGQLEVYDGESWTNMMGVADKKGL